MVINVLNWSVELTALQFTYIFTYISSCVHKHLCEPKSTKYPEHTCICICVWMYIQLNGNIFIVTIKLINYSHKCISVYTHNRICQAFGNFDEGKVLCTLLLTETFSYPQNILNVEQFYLFGTLRKILLFMA